MIHIDDKFIVPGNNISDLVAQFMIIFMKGMLTVITLAREYDYIGQRIMCPKNDRCDLINCQELISYQEKVQHC